MSEPWIKMRHNLQTNPNVIRFCDSTGMTPREAVGTLYDLWTWADQHTVANHGL